MITTRLILAAAALSLPLAAALPAYAVTAHNVQTGASTTNSNEPNAMDNKMDMKMPMKPIKMKKKHMKTM